MTSTKTVAFFGLLLLAQCGWIQSQAIYPGYPGYGGYGNVISSCGCDNNDFDNNLLLPIILLSVLGRNGGGGFGGGCGCGGGCGGNCGGGCGRC